MAGNTRAERRSRAVAVAAALAHAYPRSTCALVHASPFQLLVATMLSAQTTDLAVNRVTRGLFAQFPDARAMADAPDGAIEAIVNSIGLWRNKAHNVRATARILVERHAGHVPPDMATLCELPGVGRKTATAVLGTAFGLAAGITVDTHMLRINRLLGLSRHADAGKMADELQRLLPTAQWPSYTHRIIDHGRLVCVARRPRCGVCPLARWCASAGDPKTGYKPSNDEREPATAAGLSWLALAKA